MSASSYEAPSSARAVDVPVPGAKDTVAAARCVLADLVTTGDHAANIQSALAVVGAAWLQRHGLAALAYVRCQTLPDLPAETLTELKHAYYAALAETALLRQAELITVLKALSDSGIAPVPFKGAALAFTVYPKAACRPMGDIDLWIEEADLPRAQAALEASGYHFVFKPDRPQAFKALHGEEIQLYGPPPAAGLVELHGGVFVGEWIRLTALVDETAVRQRLRPTDRLGQPPVALLAPEDAVLQVLVHTGVNHQFSMSMLRSLIDVALLVRSGPFDWTAVAERAREWRIATVTWLGLSLASDLVGLDEAAEVVRQLQPSALRCRLLHRFVNAQTLVEMRNLSASKWRYVYLLLVVDRKRDILKLIFRTLWPEREWLLARYGRYTFSTRLRHLFDAARGQI